jgi:hypothetical protein
MDNPTLEIIPLFSNRRFATDPPRLHINAIELASQFVVFRVGDPSNPVSAEFGSETIRTSDPKDHDHTAKRMNADRHPLVCVDYTDPFHCRM